MKGRSYILSFISFVLIIYLIPYFRQCYQCIDTGCANDSKMIFIITSFVMLIIGVLKLLLTNKQGIRLIYKIYDFVFCIASARVLFIEPTKTSMWWGILLGIIILITNIIVALMFMKNSKHLKVPSSNK